MKSRLFILATSMFLFACEQRAQEKTRSLDLSKEKQDVELTFPSYVKASLKEKAATVVLDALLKPGEERELPDVVGANSVGFFVDEQFVRDQAGGCVHFEGSDGSESRPSVGGEMKRTDGVIQASYKATNEGSEVRRILVYTTKAEQVVGDDAFRSGS